MPVRPASTPFSARYARIAAPSRTGAMSSIWNPIVYLFHEDRHSCDRCPPPDHLHHRRALRPRAAASDQRARPPRTPPAVGVRPAAAARVDRRHRVDRAGGGCGAGLLRRPGLAWQDQRRRRHRRCGAVRWAQRRPRSRRQPIRWRMPATGASPSHSEPVPPLVLDAAGRQKLVEEASGKSARQVRRMLADLDPGAGAAGRPRAPARRRALRVEGRHRHRLPTGAGAAPRAAVARGPTHDRGAARRPHRAGGARPPRPEPAAAPGAHRHPGGGGRFQARFGVEGARRARTRPRYGGAGRRDRRPRDSDSGGDRGGDAAACTRFPAIAGAGHGVCRRHHSDSGAGGRADAAPEAGLGGSADPARSDGPTSRCPHDAGRHHFDREAARFGPRDSGGGETTGVAAGRGPLQLPRPADRTALQLTTYDRDGPHPAVCAGRRCRSGESETRLSSSSPSSARAARLNGASAGSAPEAAAVAPPSVSAHENPVDPKESGALGTMDNSGHRQSGY